MLRAFSGERHQQRVLLALQRLWQLYQTIWMEGVWEVVSCESSPTKFIITDSPVTTFNPQIYPGSAEVRSVGMARIERIGTRTIFPLGPDHCLVIANLQLVRNPGASPMRVRENPRYFGQTLFDLRKVQRGRQIDEAEVIAINHVLKSHATRYIAAAKEEWLQPELVIGKTPWPKIGGRYFLMPDPRKVSFSTAMYVGQKDGSSWGVSEYGHRGPDSTQLLRLREKEWDTFQAAQRAWNERDRRAGREPAPVHEDFW
jgi:hypothetical protein